MGRTGSRNGNRSKLLRRNNRYYLYVFVCPKLAVHSNRTVPPSFALSAKDSCNPLPGRCQIPCPQPSSIPLFEGIPSPLPGTRLPFLFHKIRRLHIGKQIRYGYGRLPKQLSREWKKVDFS